MAELRKVHLSISKGMKLYCTVEQASEDVLVVSLKHKTKEYRGVLLDSSERHLPAGLCFNSDDGNAKPEGDNATNTGADGSDPTQPKEIRGVTLDCRYSYNNDPAKYNEQPLPTTSAISIRPARGKQVRNIRLRPRQTLCSKCKAAIHDSKSKSPNKLSKSEGQEQESHPHNTRYRAALSSKPNDTPNTPPGPTLRSGSRNKRSDSTPKVLLENIRPKREVKPTAKKREADAAQRSRLADASSKKNNVLEDRTGDSVCAGKPDSNRAAEGPNSEKKEDENYRVMLERPLSIDNPTALGQYNKQPVVRLDKSAVNNMNIRTEVKEEKQEKAPTISIVNIRSTPAIKISFGAGDRDVLKIPPRLPGMDLKSPDDHSTADESSAAVTPPRPPSPPQKKTKKASRRTRDKQKQRYRVINDGEAASEVHAPGIKIAGYHRKHKRKHKHRHASSEDENFNSEVDIPPPAKLPAIITKLSVVPSVNDLNGNEKKGDSEVLKDSSNETPTRQEDFVETVAKSPFDLNDSVSQIRKNEAGVKFEFDDDPLKLKSENVDSAAHYGKLDPASPRQMTQREDLLDQSETTASESLPPKLEAKPFEMWASPVGTPAFEMEGSPTQIEAPAFQTDDSQDGLIVGPLSMGISPTRDENLSSFDSVPSTPPHASDEKEEMELAQEDEEKKDPVPYGVGMFEDLTPDEDEDDHDDNNVSQPMYELPKKSRLSIYPGWSNDSLSASPHVSGYLSKKSDDPSSLYPSQTGVYQNGPSSFFSAGPSSLYGGGSSTSFPSSPAPRIQNSPTPIIQRSPMPIFNYSSSRYQSSPNRRFGSSPSRRFHSLGESGSSRQQSVIAGNLNHSRYQGHDADRFQPPREGLSNTSSGFHAQNQSRNDRDVSHSTSANRYPSKFDSQAAFRYQPSSDKGGVSRYPSQSQGGGTSVSRLSTEESSLSSSKPQESADSSSVRYVWSSGESRSLPRFAIPSNGSSSVPQYPGQGGSMALPGYPSHPVDGSLPPQYPSLGSSEVRFQPRTESPYKAHSTAHLASPLSLQKNSRGVSGLGSNSVFVDDKERKGVLQAPCYETVDTSALFMTHSHIQTPVSSNENVPRFLNKPLSSGASQNPVARIPSADSAKAMGVFSGSPDSNPPVPLYQQNAKVLTGTGSGTQGVLMMEASGGSSSSIPRHPSSSSLSQGNISVSISDSEDDSDNAVPGLVPTSGVLNSSSLSPDLSHIPLGKLQAQGLMASCVGEDGREIRAGHVHWGKVGSFPWWPCRVLHIKLTPRDPREQPPVLRRVCHVSWYGSKTVSDIHPADLRPFREEFSKRHLESKRGPYQLAVQQALIATDSPASSAAAVQQPFSLQELVS